MSVVGDGRTTASLLLPRGRAQAVRPRGKAAATLQFAQAPPLAPVAGSPLSFLRLPLPKGRYEQYSLVHFNTGFPQGLVISSMCVVTRQELCTTRRDSFTTASAATIFGGTLKRETTLRPGVFSPNTFAQLEVETVGVQSEDDLIAIVVHSI